MDPLRRKWVDLLGCQSTIITDKNIQAAKRATGTTTGATTRVTAAVVQNAPNGSKLKIWTSGAVENNLTAYIETLCYF